MTARAALRPIDRWAEGRADQRGKAALMRVSTALICISAGVMVMLAQEAADIDRLFAETAMIFGCVLAVSLAVEANAGLRNVLRADTLMLVALYGLIFLEFLFPQDSFVGRVSLEGARTGTTAALIGFAGIALGRHAPLHFAASRSRPRIRDMSRQGMMKLFLLVAVIGYLHILLAVSFDLFEAIRQMALPRFAQSWGRGQFGGVDTLIYELGLLIYLIPPLAGTILADARRYSPGALVAVTLVLTLTLYKGFAGGTRNEFLVYVIMLLVAYLLARPRISSHELTIAVIPAVIIAAFGSAYMLEFRKIGLANYDVGEFRIDTVFIDFNLLNISQLTEIFPEYRNYLGWEVPFHALIRPIPRAIWSGKPEGLSVGIEEALGAEGLTLSASFVGEAYMAGGFVAVTIAALCLGSLAASWNRVEMRDGSRYNLILYVSGFFAAAIAMRSILSVAPAVLPSVALWLYGRYILKPSRVPQDKF